MAEITQLDDYRSPELSREDRDTAEFGDNDVLELRRADPRLAPLNVARAAVSESLRIVDTRAENSPKSIDMANIVRLKDFTSKNISQRKAELSDQRVA